MWKKGKNPRARRAGILPDLTLLLRSQGRPAFRGTSVQKKAKRTGTGPPTIWCKGPGTPGWAPAAPPSRKAKQGRGFRAARVSGDPTWANQSCMRVGTMVACNGRGRREGEKKKRGTRRRRSLCEEKNESPRTEVEAFMQGVFRWTTAKAQQALCGQTWCRRRGSVVVLQPSSCCRVELSA